MKNSEYTQSYIDRLTACGVPADHASVVINDFLHELDFDGLSDYCRELERQNELAKIQP